MKRLFTSASLAAVALFGFSLLASDAQASYSGTITRSLCPAHAIAGAYYLGAPYHVSYWTRSNLCGLANNDTAGNIAEGRVSIPLDNISAKTVTVNMEVTGSATHAICGDVYVYTSTGNLSSLTSMGCSTGASINQQALSLSVSVPSQGALVNDVTADPSTSLDMCSLNFGAEG